MNKSVTDTSAPRHAHTGRDYLALAIATCGVGYMPIAPGTWGSAVGVGVFLVLRWLMLEFIHRVGLSRNLLLLNPGVHFLALQLIVITIVTLAGIWAASRTERLLQKKDPGKVVIDEVAGQLIALLPVPLVASGPWRVWIIAGFFLFRAFDIVKPYPVRRLEALPSGLGIVADDLAAGAYAAVVLSILISLNMLFA